MDFRALNGVVLHVEDIGAADGPGGTGRFVATLAGLAGLLVAAATTAMVVGPYHIPVADVLAALSRRLAGGEAREPVDTVLFSIRLPRVLAGVLVGAALAAAGASYQALFRNPLVSPDILGVSTGAGVGAGM